MDPTNSANMEEFNIADIPIEFADSGPPGTSESSSNVLEYEEQDFENAEFLEKYISGEVSLNNYSIMLSEDIAGEESIKPQPSQSRPPKAGSSYRPRGTKLPIHLRGLMGEANLRFARGDHATAEKMCLEVIRQFARAHEPYMTLAQIYENSNPVKSLEYNMIAAFCNPRNVDLWIRLAQLSTNVGNTNQAIVCYSNAIRAQPTNIDLHIKRITLLSKLHNYTLIFNYIISNFWTS